ncbi:hypothetical protein [Actinoplanes sp. NPDC051851]|uniref:hypothetical protein n=1 Tax=Actinoplanes sp. NPDC051851 TaxID=3154753 RepID=UPI00341CD282
MDTDDGPLNIPNSALLASAVGPFEGTLPASTADDGADTTEEGSDTGAAVITAAATEASRRHHD